MSFPLVAARKTLAAHVTREGLFPSVRARVRCQVIAAAEAARTDGALEGLLSSVNAHMTIQLVRARESTIAALHGAREQLGPQRAPAGNSPGPALRPGGPGRMQISVEVDYRERALQKGGEEVRVHGGEGAALHGLRLDCGSADDVAGGIPSGYRHQSLEPVLQP